MKEKKVTQTDTAAELRRLAEERLAESGKTSHHAETGEESLRIVHELRVHQIELEMQNEELRKARDEKEAALEKYADLYDFAPLGYFTLDRAETIRSVNLTGASFIGLNRSRLIGQRFGLFVTGKARPAFAAFLEKVFTSLIKEACELELLTEGNPPRIVRIEAVADASGEECRIALVDITKQKLTERVTLVWLRILKLTATVTLGELLQATLDEAEALTGSLIGFYHFLDADQKTLLLQNWSSRTKAGFCKAEGKGLHYNVSEAGVWVECIHQRHPVIHNDYASLPNRQGLPPGHAPIVRELVVPVFRGDSIVAILGMGNKPGDYTLEDLEVISLLADLAWEIIVLKIAEDALLKSEERYRSLVEATSQIVWTSNAAGEVIDDLSSMQAFSGRSREEVMGLGWSNAIHPDDIERAMAIWRHAVETGSTYNTEFRMRRHDGKYRCLSARGIPVKGKDGNIREWIGTCTDITELNDSAKNLRDSEARYRRLFESAKDGILILEAETGKVVDANPFLLQLLGYSFDALYGQYIWELGVFKDIAASREAFKTLQDNEYIRYDDLPLETLDGRPITVEFVSNVYQVEHSKVIQCSIRDMTEQKKLEQQFRQAQKMEAIGTLAGGIAHDFNNILTAIIGYGYLAQKSMGPDDPHQKNIRHMLEGADRAAHLTKDLLIFSRKQVSEKAPVDLNKIVGIVEKFLVRIIGEDIVCRLALHGEPIVVFADMHQLEQVLMNLATNARDAMPRGGKLSIATEQISLGDDFVASHGYVKPGRYALLSISDTGEGMDKETCKKIFEPFFTTKEVGKGTGLGLAVAYGIIEQHEGYIYAYSEPGIGTTFKIYLPLITTEARKVEIVPVEEFLIKGTETILLAEDDESVRRLISIVLKQVGYTVIEAVDGIDAVKKFMENRETIRLLITDLVMPKMNGKEAYDEMKVRRPGLKAIFASGYAPDAIRQKMSLDSGVVLISKPITPYTLLTKVRSLLDEGE